MRTDEELVHDVRGGETRAFDELYRRYERRLFGYVLRLVGVREVAEDLFQDVFLTVLRDRTLDLREGKFAAWLFTVARNRCLSHLRDAERRGEKLRGLGAVGPAPPPSPEEDSDRAREVALLRAALEGLPAAQHDALLLKEVGELTYREIAEIQAVPEGTAKSRLHFAIRAVRRRLAGPAT